MNDSREARSISVGVLVLSVLLATATTAAVLLALNALGSPANRTSQDETHPPGQGVLATPAAVPPTLQPFVQKDSYQPQGESRGIIYFPVPYSTIPNLKLLPADRYAILTQSEESFTWVDRKQASPHELQLLSIDPAKLLAQAAGVETATPSAGEQSAPTVPSPAPTPQPELTWEAKGVAGKVTPKLVPFEQSDRFDTVYGTEGVIYFPVPYASPPSVTLSGSYTSTTAVTDCEATHFRWKNAGKGTETWGQGNITWTAKGIKAAKVPASP